MATSYRATGNGFVLDFTLNTHNTHPEDDSPYPEVRSVVANTNDMSMLVSTFRAWSMGQSTIFLYPSSSLSQFFFRYPSTNITSMVAQLLSFPMGRIWATIGWQSGYATDIIAVRRDFYNQTFYFSYQWMWVISTQLTGFSLGGIMHRFLVLPPSMIWPTVTCALFNTLHVQSYAGIGSHGAGRWIHYSWMPVGNDACQGSEARPHFNSFDRPESISVTFRDFVISIKNSAYSFREGERCLLPVDRKRTALKEVTQEEDSEANALGGNCSSDLQRSYGSTDCDWYSMVALHHLEGYRVQTLDPGILMETQHGLESVVIQLFVEGQSDKPSCYLPSVSRFMLDSLASMDPIFVLAKRSFPPYLVMSESVYGSFANNIKRQKRILLEELLIVPPLEPRRQISADLVPSHSYRRSTPYASPFSRVSKA
ncbi:OPT oligopeptide transporter protein-domain-containing protein [Suillus occidentalis]|nr:OPT oligopeptide transporter protein-domain-containing protein [Suillus occidentalis]